MEGHVYIKYNDNMRPVENQKYVIDLYCKNKKINLNKPISKVKRNSILKLLKDSNYGDNLIMSDLIILGTSTYVILNIIIKFLEKNVNLHFVNDALEINAKSKNNYFNFNLIKKIVEIEKNSTKERIKLRQETFQKEGKKLGRKKGTKTKSIYDEYKSTIIRYSKEGVPKIRIIEKIGVGTPQGLGKYIKKLIQIERDKKEKENIRLQKKEIENLKLLSSGTI